MENTLPETQKALRDFIQERFKIPPTDADFTDSTHLFDYGYIDSFGAAELTTFVQSHFGVKISESDLVLYPMNTIEEIASFVLKRKNGEI
jgi:D-alanine--poly(phosphoribitol) ligase subunit 2